MDKPKESTKETKESAPLEDKFRIEDHGDHSHYFCETCGQGWVMPKPADPALLQPLLNHVASHVAVAKNGEA